MDRDIQAVLVTDDYRGDHAKDIRIAIEIDRNETVYQFVERVFDKLKLKKHDKKYRYQDHIELRIVRPENEE